MISAVVNVVSVCECVDVCVQGKREPHVTSIYTFGLRSKFALKNVSNDVSSHLLKTFLNIITP